MWVLSCSLWIGGDKEGRKEGREEGRKEGKKEGRKEGQKNGRTEGRQNGRTEGRKEGGTVQEGRSRKEGLRKEARKKAVETWQ